LGDDTASQMNSLDWWVDLGAVAQSFTTCVAIVVGGFWTYRAFFRQRLGQPRLIASVDAQQISIESGSLVRCEVMLENRGTVVARSRWGEIRCRQILPLPVEVQEAAAVGRDPVSEGCTEIEWPLLAERRWKWSRRAFEIEPGETDTLCADFFVPFGPTVLEIYFYLANAKKARQNLGWQSIAIVHLRSDGEPDGKEEANKPEESA